MKDVKFEVAPLDINIAKIHFHLTKIFNDKTAGMTQPFSESFECKDPFYPISTLRVEVTNFETYKITVTVYNKEKTRDAYVEAFSGTKEELIKYLKTGKLFKECKNLAQNPLF